MKNYIFFLGTLLISGVAFSQVGINTENPKGTFNIDGAKDNPTSGSAHTSAQQLNDFTVLPNGNVGIGTISPTKKLEIQTGGTAINPVTGFKLVDGNQGENKVLMSDADGIGKWDTPASVKPTVLGMLEPSAPPTVRATGSSTPIYSHQKITLTTGKWVVNAGLTISNETVASFANNYWHHAYLSSSKTVVSKTGFTHLGPAGILTSYAALLVSGVSYNFMTGSSVIEVNRPTVDVYLLIENKTANWWVYPTTAYENYFYAIPVN